MTRDKFSLVDFLSAILEDMNDVELGKFNKELGKRLPTFLLETASAARNRPAPKLPDWVVNLINSEEER